MGYEVRSLVHQEVSAQALSTVVPGARGGDRIAFRAPSHEAFFLVRAEAIADERGGAVRSNPVFACLRVRSRSMYLGFAGRLGIPWSRLNDDPRGRIYPAAGLGAPAVGVELTWVNYLFSSRRSFVPNSYLGVVLGLTLLSGYYPCPEAAYPHCSGTPTPPPPPHHSSTSWTTELRLQLRSEMFRVGRFAPLFVVDLGLGAEYVNSQVAFRNDGFGALFMSGVGGGLQFTAGRTGTVSSQIWFTAQWQVRTRLGARAVPVVLEGAQAWVDAAGVPDLVEAIWFTLGSSFALPRALN